MALRDQPYIPLYVQDFLTDEKLMECSAEAHGVYIRIMCIMHKSELYGTILLKQKDKQTEKQISNFALKVARSLPFDLPTIERSLSELIEEKVLHLDGDYLVQKRMLKDGEISLKRSKSGGEGGKKTQEKIKNFASNFAKAKTQANSEIESAIENETVIEFKSEKSPTEFIPPLNPPKQEKAKRQSSVGTIAQNPPELLMVQCYWAEWTVYAKNPRPNWTKEIAFKLAEDWYDSMKGKGWKVGKAPGTPMRDWQASSRTGIKNAEEWGKVKAATETTSTDGSHKEFSKKVVPL